MTDSELVQAILEVAAQTGKDPGAVGVRDLSAHGYGERQVRKATGPAGGLPAWRVRNLRIEEERPPPREGAADVPALMKSLRRGAMNRFDLCDALDLSPRALSDLIVEAEARGYRVRVDGDTIGTRGAEVSEDIERIGEPVLGEWQVVAAISDTHAGSKYALREQISDFVAYAHSRGVRDILHGGDILDGCYKHGRFELTHHGLDAQAQDAAETLPQLDGLRYHAITGNHDETFWTETGVDVGRSIEATFRDAGRSDLRVYGDRDAFVELGGAVVHLWHPRGGGSYARSYGIQKKVEGYLSIKPAVLLTGHWHQYCHIYERGVHAVGMPCFQGGMSRFGRSLKGGGPTMGGLILSWRIDESTGAIRDFGIEPRFYVEHRRAVRVHDPVDAERIPPAVYRQGAVK